MQDMDSSATKVYSDLDWESTKYYTGKKNYEYD